MTFTHRPLRTLIFAAAVACAALPAAAQTAPSEQDHGKYPHAAPVVNLRARIAVLDERIAMLTADMKMFTGELKVQTMATLIEALVERQTLVDREMLRMHNRMREMMRDRMMDESTANPPPEMEPDTMCSPLI
jgi:hypothetical protein